VASRDFPGLHHFFFNTFLFGSVRTVLNRVFQVKQERTFVKGMGIDLLMMGLTVLLLLLAVETPWFLTVAGAFTQHNQSWSGLLQPG